MKDFVYFPLSQISRNSLSKSLFSGACIVAVALACRTCQAQTSDQEYWQKVTSADAKIKSVKLTWKVQLVSEPDNSAKPEDEDILESRFAQQGMSKERIAQKLESIRQVSVISAAGFTVDSTLTCARVGSEIRCDKVSKLPQIKGKPVGKEKIYTTDYSDGDNGVLIGPTGSEFSPVGVAVSSRHKILKNSVPDFSARVLLLASPITDYFTEKNSQIVDDKDESFVLEMKSAENGFSSVFRATISKKMWRSIKVEQWDDQRKFLKKVFSATDFRSNGNDIWIPYGVKIETPAIKYVENYSLQKVLLNDKVSSMEVKITHSPTIGDCRFGECATYSWQGGKLPDQQKINQFFDDKKNGRAAPPTSQESQTGNIPMLAPILGLMLLGLGGKMLRDESRKSKKNRDK